MKKLLAACVLAAAFVGDVDGATQTYEGEQASLAHARELAVAVMTRIAAGDDRGALELLRPALPVKKEEFDSTRDRTLETRATFDARFGKPVGFELLREERVSNLLIRLTYAEKRTKSMLRWQFTFYRPGVEWRLIQFNWDDNVPALFTTGALPR